MESKLADYLKLSVSRNASDLHISPGAPPCLRIDGDLVEIEDTPILDGKVTKDLIYSAMDERQRKDFETELDVDFSVILSPNIANFRVNAFHQIDGPSAVFRVIPHEIPTLEKLGSPQILKELLELPSGLILITGPTGCGKSTTLAAMIEYINMRYAYHIITIEDPIEFKHTRKKCIISQRQVPRDAGSFKEALRAALREDPDIILVGEMRDLETIRLALTAAETGHLVLATLHTSSAPRAVSRIVDVFPAGEKNIIKNLISQSLQGVVCQALVRKKNGGRAAAYEIMLGTPAVRNLIREEKISQLYSVIQTSGAKSMITMEESLKRLVDSGLVDPEASGLSAFQRELFEKS